MSEVVNIIISGFVSKIISDCVEISKSAIIKADHNRKAKTQNMQTKIFQIIVDALNHASYGHYKYQDIIYDSAEKLLKDLKNKKNKTIVVIQSCLHDLNPNVDCDYFMELLYFEICKEKNCDLFHQILLYLLNNGIEYSNEELKKIHEKLDLVTELLYDKSLDTYNKEIYSRTSEYTQKWEDNLFLNDFDKRDENKGVNVQLKEVYKKEQLPYYVWKNNKTTISTDMSKLLYEYTYINIKNRMLLILGQPGIGKSTLITWITANFIDKRDDILVYNFAFDLKNANWEANANSIFDEILKTLSLTYRDLKGKTLILDGYDEIYFTKNRFEILNGIYTHLRVNNLIMNFTLIITCREHYIEDINKIQCNYIILQPWSDKQILNFSKIYSEVTKQKISKNTVKCILNNNSILGIPLILYMIMALNISLLEENSIMDVYDRIFMLEGGIYDRCIDNKRYSEQHRISEIKQKIHAITKKIAMWIYENNPEKAFIPQQIFEKICDAAQQDITATDILIANYFKRVKHLEGIETEELYFIHRSIYEYFVAETIYKSAENSMRELTMESQEECAKNIAFYLKDGQLQGNINEYLLTKIRKLYNNMSRQKGTKIYMWWENLIDMMMCNGMFYYTQKTVPEDIINKECICFLNLLTIRRTLLPYIDTESYILKEVNRGRLERYLRLCSIYYVHCDFRQLYLTGVDLSRCDLQEVNLSGSFLEDVDLSGANLCNAKLSGAVIKGACLAGANIEGVDLSHIDIEFVSFCGANLTNTIFDENQVAYLSEKYDLRSSRVRIEETSEIICYEEYCCNKSKLIEVSESEVPLIKDEPTL